MKFIKPWLILALLVLVSAPLHAASGKVLKVLPHLLDEKGRHSLSPSLYERDAYQAKLRKERALVSTVRFDVNWKARGVDKENLRIRVELRGEKVGPPVVVEEKVRPGVFSKWSGVTVPKETYQELQSVSAWRVTLWNGDEQVAEQKSFLW